MSIQINDINAIDDDRNFSAAGIATVGSGSSTIIIDGSTSIVNVGTGITLSGTDGSISIAGTIFASSLSVPVEVSSFSPAIGATDASLSSNIILTFNQTVGFGTTGFVELRTGSASGTLLETFYSSSSGIALTVGATQLSIDPTSNFGYSEEIFPVMSSGFVVSNGSDFAGINTVGSATTYSFTTKPLLPGDSFGGGFLMCQSGGTRWVVAPSSTEVARTWYSRNDAVTTANANAACGDWFVPSCGQLQNPGYVCRTYWDSYFASSYWSNTEFDSCFAWFVFFTNGNAYNFNLAKPYPFLRVRAFRCVSY